MDNRVREKNVKCYQMLLYILCKNHETNDTVGEKIQAAMEEFPDHGQETETKFLGHISRPSGLAKTILQGNVKGKKQSRQKKNREGNFKEWKGMGHASTVEAAEKKRLGRKGLL